MKPLRYVALTVLLSVVSACALQTEPTPSSPPITPSPTPSAMTTAYPFTTDDFPTLDGSTATIPLGSLILQRLTGMPKSQADNIQFTTTSFAYSNMACQDPLDPSRGQIVLGYEPSADMKEEISNCEKLEYHPIGRDALVFISNNKNPIDTLTTAQYKDIYTGKITNWSQLGGDDEKIVAYQRPETSGSQALMRKFVMGSAAMASAPKEYQSGEMGDLVDGVASYNDTGNAIGYSVYYYVNSMYAVPGIKILAADGIFPTSQTIAEGSYPYVNDFYAVIRADEPKNGPARKVVAWLESDQGQQTVADAGYVKIR